jgi:ribonucleoside-diphosphate reductase alpha chain
MPKYSGNAISIYRQLYMADGEQNPEDVHARVAKALGIGNEQTQDFLRLMNEKKFRPNTPALINAGRPGPNRHNHQYCACFVLGLDDSMESIIELWQTAATVYASGAGVGMPITNLREEGAPISTGGQASGPLTYMNVIEAISGTVKSGGRTRRAANKADFWFNHPDVFKIVNSKLVGDLQAFNISMMVNDEYMKHMSTRAKVKDKGCESEHVMFPYQSPTNWTQGNFDGTRLWENVIHNAWLRGDPGLQFYDTTNRFNPLPSMGAIEATNACGEVPLIPWSVCNLGSINLKMYISFDDKGLPIFDWDQFSKDIYIAMQFLDNVIDKTAYLNDNFEQVTKATRPTGLGLMGFADILYTFGIRYGSTESRRFFEKICWFLNKEAIRASIQMVADGKHALNIPEDDKDHFRNLIKYYTGPMKDDAQLEIVKGEFFDSSEGDNEILKEYDQHGIRNTNWTCIAPTGSIALSADASYAWEPLFALAWDKPIADSHEVLHIVDDHFRKILPGLAKEVNRSEEEILDDIKNNHGSIQSIPYIPDKYKEVFAVAHDIDPMEKLEMQAAGQKWISQAISNTTNLPHDASVKDVEDVYIRAWELGLKGITVFRDGCLGDQPVHFGKQKIKEDDPQIKGRVPLCCGTEQGILGPDYERPITLYGPTVKVKTPTGKLYVTMNWDRGNFVEVFLRIGKSGGDTTTILDGMSRVISKSLQRGLPTESIIASIADMISNNSFFFKVDDSAQSTVMAHSILDAVAKVFDWHCSGEAPKVILPQMSAEEQSIMDQRVAGEFSICPFCGQKGFRVDVGGCKGGTCVICGGSNCQG